MKSKINIVMEARISESQKILYQQVAKFVIDLKKPKDARVAAEENRQSVEVNTLPMIF